MGNTNEREKITIYIEKKKKKWDMKSATQIHINQNY